MPCAASEQIPDNNTEISYQPSVLSRGLWFCVFSIRESKKNDKDVGKKKLKQNEAESIEDSASSYKIITIQDNREKSQFYAAMPSGENSR